MSNISKFPNIINKTWHIAVVGGILGFIVFVSLFGIEILNPTLVSPFLIRGSDPAAHYIGWSFFRNTPWQFPFFGLIDNLVHPESISII